METNITEMDDLFEQTSKDLMRSYADENVIRTGTYQAQVRTVSKKTFTDDEMFDGMGRTFYSLATTLYDPNDAQQKMGETWIRTSNEKRFRDSGRLDAESNRYAELVRLNPTLARSETDFMNTIKTFRFMIRVREQYAVPEEDLLPQHVDSAFVGNNGLAYVSLDAEDNEAREHYASLGIEARVQIVRIYGIPKAKRGAQGAASGNIPF